MTINTINIEELRMLAQDYKLAGQPMFLQTTQMVELLDRLEVAESELETERMRLAACGIAALGYFEGCAKEYTSASLDDVLNLRKRLEAAEKERDELLARVEQMEQELDSRPV